MGLEGKVMGEGLDGLGMGFWGLGMGEGLVGSFHLCKRMEQLGE